MIRHPIHTATYSRVLPELIDGVSTETRQAWVEHECDQSHNLLLVGPDGKKALHTEVKEPPAVMVAEERVHGMKKIGGATAVQQGRTKETDGTREKGGCYKVDEDPPVRVRLLSSHNLQHLLCQLEVWLKAKVTTRRWLKQKPKIWEVRLVFHIASIYTHVCI